MTSLIDYNNDNIVDIQDSYGWILNEQSYNCIESLNYILGNPLTQDPIDPNQYTFTTSDGQNREYLLHKPPGLKDNAPLVMVCHGYSSSNTSIKNYSNMNSYADSMDFAVCYPQGKTDQFGNKYWMVGYNFHSYPAEQDVIFLNELTVYLQNKYILGDAFQTGMSNGGELSYVLARENSIFKAYSAVAGYEFIINTVNSNPLPTPILEIHGTNDSVSPWVPDNSTDVNWGPAVGVQDTFDYWCSLLPDGVITEEELPNINLTDGSTITAYKCNDTNINKEVWLYKVVGGGHDWPGSSGNMDIDSGIAGVEFFQKFNTGRPFEITQFKIDNKLLKMRRKKNFYIYKKNVTKLRKSNL